MVCWCETVLFVQEAGTGSLIKLNIPGCECREKGGFMGYLVHGPEELGLSCTEGSGGGMCVEVCPPAWEMGDKLC